MIVAELIRTKRDGGVLPPEDIHAILAAYTRGEVPDYQMAALLMAVFWRGLDAVELAAWTDAMLRSGDVFRFPGTPGVVDKHSTGGVGDKISIPLAPLVAACGVRVPMISGRGLGHTGGTLDKLESIPGFRTDLPPDRFVASVNEIGVSMIGQTASIVPADRKLYALRDVTGTVESVPLIAASIMSKKLAEGIGGLVLDVKVGSGAFMKTPSQGRELARTLVGIGTRAGVRTVALLTAMDQPIGWAVGNALEVRESIEVLQGAGPDDTVALVVRLGGRMLLLGGAVEAVSEGEARIREAIASGAGLERFARMVARQGGDPRVVEDPGLLPEAPDRTDVVAQADGFVVSVDCDQVGLAALVLGGGRLRKEDDIDPAVGLRIHRRIGDRVRAGEPLVTLCHRGGRGLDDALDRVRRAYRVAGAAPSPSPLVLEEVS